MDICLVTAPTVAEFTDPAESTSEAVEQAASEPQLGILSLAAVLEARADVPRVVNLNRAYLGYSDSVGEPRPSEFAEFAARAIATNNASIYGFSSICSSYPLTIRIAKILKGLRPDSTILFGGPQASVVDMQTLAAFPFVDLVLRGEAERTLPQLLDQLGGERRLGQVPGLTYRLSSHPHRNANASVIEDLDALPSPAYHLTGELRGANKATLELGRGCPFACTFCSTNDFFRRNFRLRSPERVLREMRMIAAAYSIREFELVHDMFTVDLRRVAAFCEAMIASGEKFTWSCSARTDRINEELLDLMARAGCRGIFFGVEAGSRKMQKIIDKHLDPERAEEVIDATERAGIRSTVSLITGFPEETWEDLRQTIRVFMHSVRCPKSQPQLNLLAPLAETPLYSKHRNELLLEELCSGMSHQGRSNSDEDIQLIRNYPEIFPNFYAIPTPHLDRSSLLELREFALMGAARFRWLLTAIDQNTAGMLDFFLQWRNFRRQKRPELAGFELRHYYRTDTFQWDFLSFVRSHEAGSAQAVEALLDYEDTVRCATLAADSRTNPASNLVAPGTTLRRSDRPLRKKRVSVIELNCDIQRLVDALKVRSKPVWERGAHFYVTREVSAGIDRLDRVSDWMARLLRLCNGRRRIDEIVLRLSANLPEVEEPLRNYACVRLLSGAQAQNLIDIYRSASATENKRDRVASQRNHSGALAL
ncbi:MAG TPA: radical SAM protein [Candidatus Acidoferrum sp.]|nr:radical SAM protein [Candidatus Acidoferrum sp.]